jgi:hypothetical protein
MKPLRRAGLFGMLVLALVAPGTASAQGANGGRLRRPYVDIAPEGDVDAILRDNLDQLGGLDKLKELKSLLEQMAGDSDWLRDRLKGLQDGGRAFDLGNEETKQKAIKLFEEMKKSDPNILDKAAKKLNIDNGQLQKNLDELKNKTTKDGAGKGGPMGQGMDAKQAAANQQGGEGATGDSGQQTVDSVKDWFQRMEGESGLGELLRDSPAIQKAFEDYTASLLGDTGDGARWGAGAVTDNLNRAAGFFDNAFTFIDNTGSLPTPDWPSVNLPSLGGGLPSFGTPSFGGGPAVEGGVGGWQIFLWAGVVIALGLILWQVLSRLKSGGANQGAASAWRLGPWPIPPGQVATPAELIQAFEFLSLLLLGLPARTWNHRDLAVGIGGAATGGSTEKSAAAARLASVYEHARYAPGTDTLPGEELASARRDLCLLAGVGPS